MPFIEEVESCSCSIDSCIIIVYSVVVDYPVTLVIESIYIHVLITSYTIYMNSISDSHNLLKYDNNIVLE